MQVDPIKSTLKAPGTNPLTLKYDEPLSTFAFNSSLRRYTVATHAESDAVAAAAHADGDSTQPTAEVWRCRFTLSNPYRKRLEFIP